MRFLDRIRNKSYKIIRGASVFMRVALRRTDTVYLFGCPIHSNLGDQAQLMCIGRWARENYLRHRLIELNYSMSHSLMLALIKRVIKAQDVILFHSGYLMVDHHGELPVMLRVVRAFSGHRILIFPQTINLKREELREDVGRVLDGHPDLLLLCRDEISYESARTMFVRCRLLLYPDIVTTLIGTRSNEGERSGILFCVRNDAEAHYKTGEIKDLRARLAPVAETGMVDTSVAVQRFEMERRREEIIEEFLGRLATFEVVITDRYHGTIFSLIAGTPVIVLASADHKLVSGVKWFPDSFSDHVFFAPDLDQAYEIARKIIGTSRERRLPPFFKERYYWNLRSEIGTGGETSQRGPRARG